MAHEKVAYQPGARGMWIKARPTGGTCFTVSFDNLQGILRQQKRLTGVEIIERVEIDRTGITVYIGNATMRPTSQSRV